MSRESPAGMPASSCRPTTAFLEDLGSLNHTFLRGAQISSAERLAKGDVIRFGVTDVTFRDSAVETERVGQRETTGRIPGQRR